MAVSDAEREMVDQLASFARSLVGDWGGSVETRCLAGLPTFSVRPGRGRPGTSVIGEQWIVLDTESGLRWELDYTSEGMATARRLIEHTVAGTLTRYSDRDHSPESAVRRWLRRRRRSAVHDPERADPARAAGNPLDDPVVPGHVISRDGTSIGYLRQGTGPGVVLVQGAMGDVHAYRELALALAPSFTVITAERRGRGISPRPYSADHTIARDVEDLDAIMTATGATALFGLSSGAVIVLEAARTLPQVERLAVYEPPFYRDGIDRPRISRLGAGIEDGHLGAALVDALVAAGTAPPLLARAPRPLARALGRIVLAVQARQPGPASSLRELLPGVRYDFHDVAEQDGHLHEYVSINRPVLLLSGTASPAFLRAVIRELADIIPGSNHVELDGLGHDGPWNGGGSAEVAAALRIFFTP